jgi:hypothetical protein
VSLYIHISSLISSLISSRSMGNGSKVSSVICRIMELISAGIVAGLVGEYLHKIDDANQNAGPRTVYAEALAGISLFFSIAYLPPLTYSFYGFFIDFSLFICWMVAFGLLDSVSITYSSPPPRHEVENSLTLT